MIRSRTAVALTAAALLAGCGPGTNASPPVPVASATPSPAPSSTTLAVGTTPGTLALPAANGAVATVSLSGAAGTAANASITVTASTSPPAGITPLASVGRAPATGRTISAVTRVPLAYFTFVPNVDIQLAAFPAFTITFPASILPAGTTVHEGFLDASTSQPVYTLDIAFGANSATLTATASAPKLLAGRSYVFVFYYETGSAASPTPAPSTTPAPTATPAPTMTPAPSSTPTPTASPTPASDSFFTAPTSVVQTPFSPTSINTGLGSVAAGPDGKLYYADAGAHAVQRIDPALGLVTYPQQFNDNGFVSNVSPTSVVKGRDGRMWFTTSENYVFAFSTDAFSQVFKRAGKPSLRMIVSGPDGNLWAIGDTAVATFSTSGTETDYTLPANANRQSCNAITAGPDGALWYTCYPNIIGRVTTGGAITERLTSANRKPYGIVTGADGNLWFEENPDIAPNASVGRLTPDGASLTEINVASAGLTGPMGAIVPTPDGKIWIGNNGQAFRLTVIGNGAGTFSNVQFPIQAVPPNTIFSSWVVGPDAHSLWASNFGRGALVIR